MNKYTMKIFDNETGKLVKSIDFNTLVAGYSHERNGEKLGGSFLDSYGTLEDLGIALHSADLAQQAALKKDPMVGIAYTIMKTGFKEAEVKNDGTDKEHTD